MDINFVEPHFVAGDTRFPRENILRRGHKPQTHGLTSTLYFLIIFSFILNIERFGEFS